MSQAEPSGGRACGVPDPPRRESGEWRRVGCGIAAGAAGTSMARGQLGCAGDDRTDRPSRRCLFKRNAGSWRTEDVEGRYGDESSDILLTCTAFADNRESGN